MQQLTKLTDDSLVLAYANGNNEAFDVLLARHEAQLRTYIISLVRDEQIAEDIFQETFVKAIMTIRQGNYTATGKFAAWVARIARNLVVDHFRHDRSDMSLSTDDENYNVLNRRELADDPIEDLMVDTQIRRDVQRLVRHLPEAQRQVLIMRFYQNKSFKEIADATGVSINTALGRMRYAILSLRRMAREAKIELTR